MPGPYNLNESVVVGDALPPVLNAANAAINDLHLRIRVFDTQAAADAAAPFPPGTIIAIKAV